MPVFLLVVKSAKLIAVLSIGLTILCAVAVAGLQAASWKRTGVWNSYSLSTVIEAIKSDRVDTYVTASVGRQSSELTTKPTLIEWLLEMPVLTLLTLAMLLLVALYLYLTALEKEASTR